MGQSLVGRSPSLPAIVAAEDAFVGRYQNSATVIGLDFNVAHDGIGRQLPTVNAAPSQATILAAVNGALPFPGLTLSGISRSPNARVDDVGALRVNTKGTNGGSVAVALGRREPIINALPMFAAIGRSVDAALRAQQNGARVLRVNSDGFYEVIGQAVVADFKMPTTIGGNVKAAHIAAQVKGVGVVRVAGKGLNPAAPTRTNISPHYRNRIRGSLGFRGNQQNCS